jgi:hypothetical protein
MWLIAKSGARQKICKHLAGGRGLSGRGALSGAEKRRGRAWPAVPRPQANRRPPCLAPALSLARNTCWHALHSAIIRVFHLLIIDMLMVLVWQSDRQYFPTRCDHPPTPELVAEGQTGVKKS